MLLLGIIPILQKGEKNQEIKKRIMTTLTEVVNDTVGF